MKESDPGYSSLWKTLAMAGLHYAVIYTIFLPYPLRWIAFGAGLQAMFLMIAIFGNLRGLLRLPVAGGFAVIVELITLVPKDTSGGFVGSLCVLTGSHLVMLFWRLFLHTKIKVLTSFILHVLIITLIPLIAPALITVPELPQNYQGESIIGLYFVHNASNPAFYGMCVCILVAIFWTVIVTIEVGDSKD